MNVAHANRTIQKDMWRNNKIFLMQWAVWSEKEKSFFQVELKDVVIPAGITKKDYWLYIIRKQVNRKLGSLKSNFNDALKKVYDGEAFSSCITSCYTLPGSL